MGWGNCPRQTEQNIMKDPESSSFREGIKNLPKPSVWELMKIRLAELGTPVHDLTYKSGKAIGLYHDSRTHVEGLI